MHEHTAKYGVPVRGVRDQAPCGPKADLQNVIGYRSSGQPIYVMAGGAPLATESELTDLRAEITRLETEASADRAAADKLVEDMRSAGTDPLADKDAFEKVDEAYKIADGKLQEVADLRKRAERAMDILGKKQPERKNDKGEPAAFADTFLDSDVYKRVQELAPRDLRAAAAHMAANPVDLCTRDETVARLRDVTLPVSPSPAIPSDVRPPLLGLFDPTRILQLISTFPTDSDTVEYVVEILHDTAAAETDYGTALPESDFEFDKQSQTLKRIGHHTVLTDAQLADSPFLRGYLNQRMVEDVRRLTEKRAVQGDADAVGDQFDGILNTDGIGSVAFGEEGDVHALDTLHRAITVCRLAHVEPNGIGLHPVDYEQGVALAKDNQENYLFKIGEPTTVWGKPTAVTTAMPEGTGLVGAFEFAILLVRSAIQVLASTEHASFFLEGKVAVKAEYRAGFYVGRPAAFCEVTGITTPGS